MKDCKLLLGLIAALPVFSQFVEIAPSPGGSSVYMATPLRQTGTDQTSDPKLFLVRGPQQVTLLRTEACDTFRLTGICGITNLQAAGDGVSFEGRIPCQGGSSCAFRELTVATYLNGTQPTALPGHVRVSRSGRFATQQGTGGPPGQPVSRLLELTSMKSTELPPFESAVRVADDGRILTVSGKVIGGAGGELAAPALSKAIDWDSQGRVALLQTDLPRRLYVSDFVTHQYWQLGPDTRDSFDGSISADGSWVLYLSIIGTRPQVFISRPDGSDWKQLTSNDEGAQHAVLSADGRFAFVLSGAGSLLRIDTASGVSETWIPPTAYTSQNNVQGSPGSALVLQGIGFSTGTTLALDGAPLRPLSLSPIQAIVQLPWETPIGLHKLVISSESPFEQELPIQVSPSAPSTLAITHGDFGSLVTTQNPARRGEIVHLYSVGLGPVSPSVATGVVSPVDRLSRLEGDAIFSWGLPISQRPVDVAFAGLAPGLVGIYQVDVRVPEDLNVSGDLWFSRLSVGALFPLARIPIINLKS